MVQFCIINRDFNDIDEFSQVLNSHRNIKLTQLSVRLLKCTLLAIVFNQIHFYFSTSFNSVRCIGEKPLDFFDFSCILEPEKLNVISHGYQISNDMLFGFDPTRETDLIVSSYLTFCNILIKKELFKDCLQVMERTDIDEKFLSTNYLHSPMTILPLQSYLRELWYLLKQKPLFFNLMHLEELVLGDFIPLLINVIPINSKSTPKRLHSPSRYRIVKEAESFMMENLDKPLTLKDLCLALNSSSSPIFHGFKEIFGVSPMVYLKIHRLQGVRRLLKASDPETVSITEIANKFGFWSAGHFARDYKKMFGELPSETIKR